MSERERILSMQVPLLGQKKELPSIVSEVFTGGSEQPQIFWKPVPGQPPGVAEPEVHLGITIMDRFALEAMKEILGQGVIKTGDGLRFPDAKQVVDYCYDLAMHATAKRAGILNAVKMGVTQVDAADDAEGPPAGTEPIDVQ